MRQSLTQALVAAFTMGILSGAASQSHADWKTYGAVVVGTMTEGSWHEAVRPSQLRFAGSHLGGIAVGIERPIGDSRFLFGAEVQVSAHFGRQDHLEMSAPLVLRYVPERSTFVSSLAAGLGLSYASKVPQVEIDRNGASQRLFVHWVAEVEFATPAPDVTSFLRLHHRSDGYGIFEVDAGSTAIVLGLRRRF